VGEEGGKQKDIQGEGEEVDEKGKKKKSGWLHKHGPL